MSRPVWACGLKHLGVGFFGERYAVAPRVGVWIETIINSALTPRILVSRPVWACGLKPVQMNSRLLNDRVAPRVGVWIETP